MSYKAEVIADNSGEWCSNYLRFATKEEAADYVEDLSRRWMSVKAIRISPSDDPVNCKRHNNQLEYFKSE